MSEFKLMKEDVLKWGWSLEEFADHVRTLDGVLDTLRESQEKLQKDLNQIRGDLGREKSLREYQERQATEKLAALTKSLEVNAIYPLGACPVGFRCVREEFDVPTEMLVREGRWVEPRKGRVYSTSLVCVNSKVTTLEDAQMAKSTDQYDDILAVEIFEDQGEDAQVEYHPVGILLVKAKTWAALLKVSEVVPWSAPYSAWDLVDRGEEPPGLTPYLEKDLRSRGHGDLVDALQF